MAVGILALGLSAMIAVLTYSNSFDQLFPGADQDRVVRVFGSEFDAPYQDLSYLDFEDYASAVTLFDGLAAVQPFYLATVRQETATEVAALEAVSGGFFELLRIDMALGRGLAPLDDQPGAAPVVVISHAWWTGRYGGDPDVLGQTLFLNGLPHTVVGVAGQQFLGSTSDTRPQVWIPFAPFRFRYTGWEAQAANRDIPLVRVLARKGKGVTERAAMEELTLLAEGLDRAYPGREQVRTLFLEPANWIDPRNRLAESDTNRMMAIAAVGFLLLVCANVANLQLSVFSRRRHEVAMHAALGASPRRLFGQTMLESLLMSSVGGGIALWLALPLSNRIGSYFSRPSVWGQNVSREIALGSDVVWIAVGVSIATGLFAGLVPSLRSSGRGLVASLKTAGRRTVEGRGRAILGTHGSLVAAQVALSVVLLVVAGLVIQTLATVNRFDPGFDYAPLIASHISTSSTTLTVDEREQWFHGLADEIAREPWVESATVSQEAPLKGHPSMTWRVDGVDDLQTVTMAPVHEGFFKTMGIAVEAGRPFAAFDSLGGRDVAVINRAMAARFFEGRNAVGSTLVWPAGDEPGRAFEVVGVVGPTRVESFLAEPQPAVYLPYRQHDYPSGSALILRTNIDPAAAVPLMERWVRDYEPYAAIINVASYAEVVRGSAYTQRMNAELFSALAVLGLILASVGIFSVITLTVSRRTREMGVRKAIGATGGEISRLVIRQALWPVAAGLVIGVVAALGAADLLRGLLIGVEPTDPPTLIFGATMLLLTAILAAYLPARRAARVDPVSALGAE